MKKLERKTSFSKDFNMAEIGVFKFSEHAKIPTKGTPFSAGFDLYSAYDYTIPPHSKARISTDIGFDMYVF